MTIVQEPSADQVRAVVRALLATTGRAMGGFPDGRWHVESGLVRYSTGKPAPRLNGVAVLDGRADRGAAEAWLAELAARGLPELPDDPPCRAGMGGRRSPSSSASPMPAPSPSCGTRSRRR